MELTNPTRATSERAAGSVVALARRPLRVRRRANEIRLVDGQLVFDLAATLSEPYVVPLTDVAGVALTGPIGTRALDPDCRLARRPHLPALVDHRHIVPDMLVVFRIPRPAPSARGRALRFGRAEMVDGLRVAVSDPNAAIGAFTAAGVPVSQGTALLESAIGLEPDPGRVRAAVLARRRTAAGMRVGMVVIAALVVGTFVMMPGSLLNRGCPDFSPIPIAAATEPVLESIEGSTLTSGRSRTVAEVLDGRAKEVDLLAAAAQTGAERAWSETWTFPEGDQLMVDSITFGSEAGAGRYGEYDAAQGCPHEVARHPLGDTGVTVVQANRPGDADGWEAIVVDGVDVHRFYVISEHEGRTLRRLRAGVDVVRRDL